MRPPRDFSPLKAKIIVARAPISSQEVDFLSRPWAIAFVILFLMIGLSAGNPERRVVQANVVETIIRANEPAEFDSCTIVGDLNLSRLIITNLINFNHTTFQDSVNFEYTTFNGTADFEGSTFKHSAYFKGSTFNGTVDFISWIYFRHSNPNFKSSTFNGTADFDRSTFVGLVSFADSTFKRRASFRDSTSNGFFSFENSTFDRAAYFDDSTFVGLVSFADSTFKGPSYFRESTFDGNSADFSGSIFNDTTDFSRSTFDGSPYFDRSTFKSDANFDGSTFNGDAYFDRSTFNGTANFESLTFNGTANFVDAIFRNDASFASSIFEEEAFFYGASFNKRINLVFTEYKKLYIRWDNYHRLIFDDTTYQLLIDNLKKLGFTADADVCYYQFRAGQVLRQNPINDPIMLLLDFGSWIFYGFGKKPLYPVAWSGFFIVLFGFFWKSMGSNEPERVVIRKARAWMKWSFALILLFIILNLVSSYLLQETISPMLLVLLLLLLSTIIGKARTWMKWCFALILLFIILNLVSSYLLQETISPMLLVLLSLSIIAAIILFVKSIANDDLESTSWMIDLSEDTLSFSAAVFLSGTKFFIDPPALPMIEEHSESWIKKAFILERVLGALFSVLFFIAISGTIVRAA